MCCSLLLYRFLHAESVQDERVLRKIRSLHPGLQHLTLFVVHSKKEALVAPFQGLTSAVMAPQRSQVCTRQVEAGTMSFHIISISAESGLATEVHPHSRARARKVLHSKHPYKQKRKLVVRWAWVGVLGDWNWGAGVSACGRKGAGCLQGAVQAVPTPSPHVFLSTETKEKLSWSEACGTSVNF